MTVILDAARRQSTGLRLAVYAAVVCGAVLAVAGLVGLLLKQAWLFPSLGPLLMVVTETPRQASAHPRNVLVGHLVAVIAGWLALAVTGLRDAPAVVQQGLTGPRIGAAVLSLALTIAVLQLLRMPHAPAGATTLIVSLGILKSPGQLVTIMLSVLLVTALVTLVNALADVRQAGVRGVRPES